MRVTAENYPTVHRALDIISHDGGGRCNTWYEVPEGRVVWLDEREQRLKALSADELEEFCIGEEDTSRGIQVLHNLHGVAKFFDAFLEQSWARGDAS